MDIWNSLTDLIANPSIQSFLISCGAGASWDAVKAILKKAEKEDSFELQVYQVMKETFETFYLKYGLEFDEEIVMTSFLETVIEIKSFDSGVISKRLICDIVGIDISNQEVEEWLKIFITVCSNPKYQWVYNKLTIPSIIFDRNSKKLSWQKHYMNNNFCKIQCDMIDELPPILDGITTQLSQSCWYDTQILIWEIVFNAQEHGKAKECTLHISKNSITILDNGEQFDPLIIKSQSPQHGGGIAIKKFERDYPEIILNSKYSSGFNYFTIDFGDNVFDVNEMSEIIVPTLVSSLGIYRLKHPKGKFKYYYIDMDEIPKKFNTIIRASFSGIITLFSNLKRDIEPQDKDSRVFIYFSDMTRMDYQKIYSQMEEVLKECSEVADEIGIELVMEDSM